MRKKIIALFVTSMLTSSFTRAADMSAEDGNSTVREAHKFVFLYGLPLLLEFGLDVSRSLTFEFFDAALLASEIGGALEGVEFCSSF